LQLYWYGWVLTGAYADENWAISKGFEFTLNSPPEKISSRALLPVQKIIEGRGGEETKKKTKKTMPSSLLSIALFSESTPRNTPNNTNKSGPAKEGDIPEIDKVKRGKIAHPCAKNRNLKSDMLWAKYPQIFFSIFCFKKDCGSSEIHKTKRKKTGCSNSKCIAFHKRQQITLQNT
jgi:hypothetical protein